MVETQTKKEKLRTRFRKYILSGLGVLIVWFLGWAFTKFCDLSWSYLSYKSFGATNVAEELTDVIHDNGVYELDFDRTYILEDELTMSMIRKGSNVNFTVTDGYGNSRSSYLSDGLVSGYELESNSICPELIIKAMKKPDETATRAFIMYTKHDAKKCRADNTQ